MSMEVATVAIVVMILGLVVLTVEAFFPGGYLLIPGAILVIVGAYGYAAPDNFYTMWTPAVAIISAVPVTAATVFLYKRLGSPEVPSTTVSDSLIGKEGTVVVGISPIHGVPRPTRTSPPAPPWWWTTAKVSTSMW